MSVRPYRDIYRRKSRQIFVGSVPVGGDAPISVQTMTNTLTTDVEATVAQIRRAEEAGADIVRVSCPDEESTAALKHIVKQVTVPIVADIHFHYKRAIEAAEAGAACLRINPGNIGSADRVKEVVQAAKDHNCSMRIGVNAGSLEKELLERFGEPCPEAMVESALNHIRILEDNDFTNFKISCKASDVFLAVAAYNALAEACDYPLHLGITEAGGLRHFPDAIGRADIAGIDAQAGGAGLGGLDGALIMEMDVGDDRDLDLLDDVLQRRGRFLVGARDAHDVDAGLFGAADLRDRRLDVGGQRVGHRLHADRGVAADRHIADHDLTALTPVNVSVGPNAHRRCSSNSAKGTGYSAQIVRPSKACKSRPAIPAAACSGFRRARRPVRPASGGRGRPS